MKGVSIYIELLVAFIVFFALAFIIPVQGDSSIVTVILSISTFTFAIILAFSMSARHARLSAIKETFRDDDAILVSLNTLAAVFGKQKKARIRALIDEYLQAHNDYDLPDFDQTTPAFIKLFEYVSGIESRTKSQDLNKDKMIDLLNESLRLTKKGVYLVRSRMLGIEWGSMIILAVIIWACLYYLNDGSLFAVVIIPFLQLSILLLLLVVREIDNLRWGQKSWLYLSLRDLYKELDIVPYYNEMIVGEKWFDEMIEGFDEYRIASYPNPYPDITGKKVTLHKVPKKKK